ncbi:MAG: hypothetical protein AB1489_35595 [Acidobacteriota bacterium]
MPEGVRRILDEAGLTILPTGIVKIRESYSIFFRVIAGDNVGDEERAYKAQVAYRHECVHFLQAVTTSYVFNYGEQVRSLAGQFCQWLSNKERDMNSIRELISLLNQLEGDLDRESGSTPIDGIGVSPRQLMEATAIIESIRSLHPDIDVFRLLDEIPRHTNGVLYGRVLGITIRVFGPSTAINITPIIVFLALNALDPGTAFGEIVTHLFEEYPPSYLDKCGPADIMNLVAPNMDGSLISVFANGQRISMSPFWNDVGITFAKSGPLSQMYLVAAYTSSILAQSSWSKQIDETIRKCVPPIIMFEDGLGSIQGIGKDLTEGHLRGLLIATEMIGAMYRVGLNAGYETLCMQQDCPARSSALCHMAYPPAPSPIGRWEDCSFRDTFQSISGETPERFAERYGL